MYFELSSYATKVNSKTTTNSTNFAAACNVVNYEKKKKMIRLYGPFYHDSELISWRVVRKSGVIHGVPSIFHVILKMTTRLRVNCYLEISRPVRERERERVWAGLGGLDLGFIEHWVLYCIKICFSPTFRPAIRKNEFITFSLPLGPFNPLFIFFFFF